MSSEIENRLQERGVTIDGVIAAMQQFSVETPSWGYGNSGTRFKVFHWPGAASNLREKLADAAQVQKVTGICPGVACAPATVMLSSGSLVPEGATT